MSSHTSWPTYDLIQFVTIPLQEGQENMFGSRFGVVTFADSRIVIFFGNIKPLAHYLWFLWSLNRKGYHARRSPSVWLRVRAKICQVGLPRQTIEAKVMLTSTQQVQAQQSYQMEFPGCPLGYSWRTRWLSVGKLPAFHLDPTHMFPLINGENANKGNSTSECYRMFSTTTSGPIVY